MNSNVKLTLSLFLITLSGCSNSTVNNYSEINLDGLRQEIQNNQIIPIDSISPPCGKFVHKNNNLSKKNQFINKIQIEIPNSRKWYKNIFEAYTSSNISSSFKKRFNANISWKLDSTKTCKYPARIRISGDWNDHIAIKNSNVVASLDIKLKKGNFNGYTWFKLLIPETRNGDSEIFSANLMRELGFISPRTHYVNVEINGSEYLALAQENAAKEMLENNNKRESTILETIEDPYWTDLNLYYDGWFSPKVINKRWAAKSNVNKDIAFKSLNLFSIASNDINSISGNNPYTAYSDKLLGGTQAEAESDLKAFRVILIALGGRHGLNNLNRKFYYDSFQNHFDPIYYDGNTYILKQTWLSRKLSSTQVPEGLIQDLSAEDIDNALLRLKNINVNKFRDSLILSGLNISLEKVHNILDNIYLKIDSINYFLNKNTKELKYKNIQKFDIIPYGRAFHDKENKYLFCIKDLYECYSKDLNPIEINKLFAGDYRNNEKSFLYSGRFEELKSSKKLIPYKSEYRIFNNFGGTDLYVTGKPSIFLSKSRKLIDINLNSSLDKVVFKNGSLEDLTIRIDSPFKTNSLINQRYDSSLITGQITFMDLNVKNIKIISDGGLFEDSINFIRSKGTIDQINIANSRQDALDLDFSELAIGKLIINNAGNDCLDVSSGIYFVNSAILEGCKDKAISVGEGALLRLNKSDISSSYSAFVVKDSSSLYVNNATTKNINNCFQLYRKKQEFGGSYFAFNNLTECTENDSYVQKGSFIERIE